MCNQVVAQRKWGVAQRKWASTGQVVAQTEKAAKVAKRRKGNTEAQRKHRAIKRTSANQQALADRAALDSSDPKVAIPAVLAALCNQVVAQRKQGVAQRKRDLSEEEEEVKNNCYMCSLNGRPAAECCIEMQPGSKPAAFLNEHGRGHRGVLLCPWFGRKFPDDAERDTKAKMARRARKQADSQAIQAAQYSARKKQKL